MCEAGSTGSGNGSRGAIRALNVNIAAAAKIAPRQASDPVLVLGGYMATKASISVVAEPRNLRLRDADCTAFRAATKA
jgi:hypothetical protein